MRKLTWFYLLMVLLLSAIVLSACGGALNAQSIKLTK